MRFENKTIALAGVRLDDATYRITTAVGCDDLKPSIASLGIIHPPILRRIGETYRIVSGFRRIEACRLLNEVNINAWLLPDAIDELTCARLAVADNSLQRPLNLIETSRALNLLAAAAGSEHFSRLAAELHLPDNPELIRKIMALDALPPALKSGVMNADISLTMALELNRMETGVGETLALLFGELNLGLNRQRELLTLLTEIAQREEKPIGALLAEPDIRNVWTAADLDRAQKAARLRTLLKRRRYPAISDTAERFQTLVGRLNLDSGVTLTPPGHFEGTTYTLTISFDRLEQLAERARRLPALAQNQQLRRFLDR